MKKMHQIICEVPPPTEEIRQLLASNETVDIKLKTGDFPEIYLYRLKHDLPEHSVLLISHLKMLLIAPSLSTDFILRHIDVFKNCIIEFDTTAHMLMQLLAETFSIDLAKPDEVYDLKRKRSVKQRGEMNEEWSYQFHGSACSFTNKITNQFIDVTIQFEQKYGLIDCYYLLEFIKTNPKLQEAALLLNNRANNLGKVLDILKNESFLEEYHILGTIKLMLKKNI